MGEEKGSEWYNNVYLSIPITYYEHPENYWYAPLWDAILDNVYPTESIGDFGCGVGQFAKMCTLRNKYYARGIDFSDATIKIAKEMNPALTFVVGSLKDKSVYNFDFDVAVFCETLEHIENDIEIVKMIPKGKKVIISLPTYDYKSHVRHIQKPSDVFRYQEVISYNRTELISLDNGQEENSKRDVYLILGVRG